MKLIRFPARENILLCERKYLKNLEELKKKNTNQQTKKKTYKSLLDENLAIGSPGKKQD